MELEKERMRFEEMLNESRERVYQILYPGFPPRRTTATDKHDETNNPFLGASTDA